jgi:hypothetical protein
MRAILYIILLRQLLVAHAVTSIYGRLHRQLLFDYNSHVQPALHINYVTVVAIRSILSNVHVLVRNNTLL